MFVHLSYGTELNLLRNWIMDGMMSETPASWCQNETELGHTTPVPIYNVGSLIDKTINRPCDHR